MQSRCQLGCIHVWKLDWGKICSQANSNCCQNSFPCCCMRAQVFFWLAAGGRPGTARYSWTHCSGLPELGCWSVQPPQEIPQCSPSATPAYSSHPPPPSSRITSVPAPLCHLPQLGTCSQEPLKRAAAGALWRAVSTSIPVWLGRAGPELLGVLLAAAVLLLVHRDLSSFSSPFALGALWSTSPLAPGL